MENKLTKIVAVLTVVGLMAAGPFAYAQYGEGGPKDGKGYKRGGGQEFFKELHLTPEQKEKLKAQRESERESNEAVREQLKAKMKELHEAIAKPETTRESVNGLVGEVSALKAKMFSQRTDGIFAMKEVLTPEQFSKMEERHKKRMNGPHGDWGRRPPEPDEE